MKYAIVVPWVTDEEIGKFKAAWQVSDPPDWLVLQHDSRREGCAVTKNRGIDEAISRKAEMIVVLDGDCFPSDEAPDLPRLAELHEQALEPTSVPMFQAVTDPPSRGTPYADLRLEMPVAASMGFWTEIGDHCAVRQLATNAAPMTWTRDALFGRYFPLCGMNLAFRPSGWDPWFRFINVDRFDDIWMGWMWQREAYRRGYCFNLNGPLVRHSRQSNVWKNLTAEALHLEANETLWRKIATERNSSYDGLYSLLPIAHGTR